MTSMTQPDLHATLARASRLFPILLAATLGACGTGPSQGAYVAVGAQADAQDDRADLLEAQDASGDATLQDTGDDTGAGDGELADLSVAQDAEDTDSYVADVPGDDSQAADIVPEDLGTGDAEPADLQAEDTALDAVGEVAQVGDSEQDQSVEDVGPDTAPDTQAGPSWAAPCDSDDDCLGTGTGKKCDLGLHACATCLTSSDCAPGELCQDHACKPSKVCKSDTDCKATLQVCDKGISVCVDCVADADCGGGQCQDHACVAVTTCKTSKDCPAVCDLQKGICTECTDSVDCSTGKACYAGSCKPTVCGGPLCAGGKSFICKPDGSAYLAGQGCDDANACTDGDSCDAGLCKPGPAKVCNDGNPCTADQCDKLAGCQFTAQPAVCSDGDPCTVDDQCGGGLCAGKPMDCDDGQTCTMDSCVAGQCSLLAVIGPCTDGSACTLGDSCAAGKCQPGAEAACDDDNPCTQDSCNPAQGCVFAVINGAACDDGNSCTADDKCAGSKCSGIGVQCDDGSVCTDDKCSAGNCSYVANTKGCDDGNACTGGDACTNGKCTGPINACDDKNLCTTDTCLSVGCQSTPNSLACDDGNPCTDKDTCALTQCKGTPLACDDGNECTADTCEGGTCIYKATEGPCGGAGSCAVCQGGKCAQDTATGMEETYGGAQTDRFAKAVALPDGSLLVAGSTSSKGSGSDDGWLVKLDAKGNLVWEKMFGGSGSDSFVDIAPIDNGNYAILGTTASQGAGSQVWFLVVDGSGAKVAGTEHFFGGSYADLGRSLAFNAAGVLVAAQKQSYSGSVSVTYGWLLQLDGSGNKLWEKDLTNLTDATGIVALEDQSVVIGHGYSATTASQDIIIQRLKSGGAQVWATTVGAKNYDYGHSVAVLADKTLIATGRTGYYGTDPTVILHLDGDGQELWQTSDPSLTGDLTEVVQLGANLLFSGHIRNSSQWDGRIVSLSLAGGKLLWAKTAGFSQNYDDILLGIVPFGPAVALVGAAYAGGGAGVDGWLLGLTAQGQISCACDTKCDDGNPCTADACYLGICKSKPATTGSFCLDGAATPGKCDAAQKCVSTCGNGYCDSGETLNNCPKDCKVVVAHPCDNACGGVNSTYNCYCDTACKKYGDCCQASGAKGTSCAGSTCAVCK